MASVNENVDAPSAVTAVHNSWTMMLHDSFEGRKVKTVATTAAGKIELGSNRHPRMDHDLAAIDRQSFGNLRLLFDCSIALGEVPPNYAGVLKVHLQNDSAQD